MYQLFRLCNNLFGKKDPPWDNCATFLPVIAQVYEILPSAGQLFSKVLV